MEANCPICNKPLCVEDGTRELDHGSHAGPFDERVPHAMEHLSSEARGVVGLINSLPPELVVEIVKSYCPDCGAFTRHQTCDCGAPVGPNNGGAR